MIDISVGIISVFGAVLVVALFLMAFFIVRAADWKQKYEHQKDTINASYRKAADRDEQVFKAIRQLAPNFFALFSLERHVGPTYYGYGVYGDATSTYKVWDREKLLRIADRARGVDKDDNALLELLKEENF